MIYPTDISCILYMFIGDEGEIVEIKFVDFDLQLPTASKYVNIRFYSRPFNATRVEAVGESTDLTRDVSVPSSVLMLCVL